MTDEAIWIISTGFGLVTLIGGIIARDRYILGLISKNHEGSIKAIQDSSEKTNERMAKIKDEYVRRIDLDGHIMRLDGSIKALSGEMRSSTAQTNQRLDAILAHFAKNGKAD
jgi:uncharacterized protein YciW